MLPKIHISIERWRKNTEYGVYVSNQGRVRLIKNKQYLEPRINNTGYCTVFTEQGAIMVHRLVAYTWMGGKRNAKYTIDHINSNKRDNRVKNLRWVTEKVNLDYAKYTKCDLAIKETFPQTAIEEVEKLWGAVKNLDGDEEIRGQAILRLLDLRQLKLHIRYEKTDVIETREQLIKLLHPNGNLAIVAARISKAALIGTKAYCGHFWKMENIKGEVING